MFKLRSVYISLSKALRPATCSQDPAILTNKQTFCNESVPNSSREQVAGSRNINYQQTLNLPKFVFILCSVLLIAATDLSQLYHKLNANPNQNISARITRISAEFLGKPYELGALGEGQFGDYDQFPLFRTDAFDCETYVDTVLALALAHDDASFQHYINQIRYKNGQVSFITRNHFTDLDWNINNQKQGFMTDITTNIRDADDHPVAFMAQALIDKPSWYQHFSTDKIRIKNASKMVVAERLSSLKQAGLQLPRRVATIPYLPLSALFKANGQPNMYLFKQIPNAAIIEIIRPDWDLQNQIGTHLNVSHLGFAIWKNGQLFFRQASSTQHQVVDSVMIDYLRDAISSPTIKGINVQVVRELKNPT